MKNQIKIQSVNSGIVSSSMTVLGRSFFEVTDIDNNVLGHVTGDNLNNQLKQMGFTVVEYVNSNNKPV